MRTLTSLEAFVFNALIYSLAIYFLNTITPNEHSETNPSLAAGEGRAVIAIAACLHETLKVSKHGA